MNKEPLIREVSELHQQIGKLEESRAELEKLRDTL